MCSSDLLILVIAGTVTAGGPGIQFNSDTGTNYSFTGINGSGSAASSFRVTNNSNLGIGEMRTYQSNIIVQIQNYSNATTYKTVLSRANTASDYVQGIVGLWRSTSAITTIDVKNGSGNFATGCVFTLYGIKAA